MNPPDDWARAYGQPVVAGRIRTVPADFRVREILGIDFSGDGEHDWLHIEKTGANTHWVAEALARHAGVKPRDVGYAGLKDRHAVTTQWFSVRRKIREPTDWDAFVLDGARILERHVHARKLQRGAHQGNSFRIAVRADALVDVEESIADRIGQIAQEGVPNYFGEQRFGRGGANVELGRAVVAGRRAPRHKRSIGISALRSWQFNEELDARVREGSWNRLRAGDLANLDGTNSTFRVDELTAELEQRCLELDIHPAGALPALETIGVEASARPLRMRVVDLKWEIDGDALWLDFSLGSGCFATSVLREIATLS